ncbi:MAG: hypothetical protein MUE54_04965 [Anaerolineae bacterium]|jgi:hypothetical protein|nr:hypothetical protein [Anaerolineae bacterium]
MSNTTEATPSTKNNSNTLILIAIASIAAIAVIILLINALGGSSVSRTNQFIGNWGSENGTIININANGTFRWETAEGWQSGTWTRDADILTFRVLDSSAGGAQATVGAQITSVSETELVLTQDGQAVTYTRQ